MEEEEDESLSFKLQRSRFSMHRLAGGSKSSRLLQDSISKHNGTFVPLPRYDRLSQSTRVFSEKPRQNEGVRRLQKGGWIGKVMGRVFFLHEFDGDGGETKEGEVKEKERRRKKKRSSWLPDPERRWPVQGW